MNDPNTEKTIFVAVRQLPPADRAAYLDQACGDNEPLRRRIEALLNASEQSGAFLEVSAAPTLRRTPAASIPLAEKPGDKVGHYKLLQQIGEGGCGVVYMAEQEEPVRRRVALKIIKLGMDTRNVMARFEAERQALAMMDHPNIAKVFDAGATETGRPYFVMELVRGIKITDYCDEAKLSIRARLDLFTQVCHAIQHAHQKGIIHRDIKPSNILVTMQDCVPVPKVIDFGIVKATGGQLLTDKTIFTAFEHFIGTPAYMSPEQAMMTSQDIDTRSDIYALGVLLYELLTGRTPFDAGELLAAGLDEMRRTIREQEPARPSTCLSTMPDNELSTTAQRRKLDAPKLVSELRGDLDCVVMKALEKDRARRYETANGLAMDIQRHLDNEPVVARPPNRFYRFQKMVRRHKFVFAAAAIVAFTLLGGILVSSWYAVRSARAEKVAENERRQAEVERTKAREAEAESKAVNDFLQQDLLRQAGTDTQADEGLKVDPNITLREVVDRAAARLDNRFTNQPLVEASIRMTLAEIYDVMGDPAATQRHARRAVELRERILGPDHPLTLAAMSELCSTLTGIGNPTNATALGEKTLGRLQVVLGREHPDTLKCMIHLGNAYVAAGRFNDAVTLLQEALTLQKSKLGPTNGLTLWIQHDLGYAYDVAGRVNEAVPLLEETVRAEQSVLGQDHPLTLASMVELAVVYERAGRINDAFRLDEETLKLCKIKLGPDHPNTLTLMNSLAQAYGDAGQLDKEVALFEETLKLRQAKLGPDDPLTLASMNCLGEAYADAGRFEDALKLQKECLQRYKSKLGQDDPFTLGSMNYLAWTYQRAGKLDEALSLYQESLNLCKTKFPAGHRFTIAAMNGLAQFFESTGQMDKGISLREEALKLSQANPDLEDSVTLENMIRLASSYHTARRLKDAVKLDETAVKLCKEKLGLENNLTRVAINNLAIVYEDDGRRDEALSLYEQTLKLYKANVGPDHPYSLLVMANLAQAYYQAGRLDKSLPMLEEGLRLSRAKLGPDHPTTQIFIMDLAGFYDKAGRSKEALPLYEEGLKDDKVKLGTDNPTTLKTMNALALAYKSAGQLSNALPLLEETFNIRMTKLGIGNQDTLRTLHDLAVTYQDSGRSADADRVFSNVLTPVFMSQPKSVGVLRTRGEFYACFGRWEEAAADLSHALDLQPDHVWTWHCLAAVLVQEGQVEAYRNLCAKSIERFGNTTDPVTAERIAKDCLILPDSGADLDRVAGLAHTASSSTNNPSGREWNQLTQGLADYRQGRFATAADWAEKALAKPGIISERDVAAFMVQAMACQQLNQPDKARAALATGQELARTKLPKAEGGDIGGYWMDWVIAQALLREAATLIEGQTPPVKDASK